MYTSVFPIQDCFKNNSFDKFAADNVSVLYLSNPRGDENSFNKLRIMYTSVFPIQEEMRIILLEIVNNEMFSF